MEEFFLALVPITLILSVSSVMIFRPLTKRLGDIMQVNAEGRRTATNERLNHEHLKTLIEVQAHRIESLEHRLEFAESLLESGTPRFLGARRTHTRQELS